MKVWPLLAVALCVAANAQVLAPASRRAVAIAGLARGRDTSCAGCENGAPIYPTNVTSATLKVWLEADVGVFKDAGSTPAADGDTVQQWNDQSGNGNNVTQSSAGSRPTFHTAILNSLPGVAFTNKFLSRTYSVSLSQPNTYFIVYQIITGTPDPGFVFDGAGATYGDSLFVNGNAVEAANNGGGGVLVLHPATVPKQMWFNDTAWLNGAGSTSSTNGCHQTTNTTAALASTSLRIGNNHIPDQAATCLVAELIVFNGYVSIPEACGVTSYLKIKWGP